MSGLINEMEEHSRKQMLLQINGIISELEGLAFYINAEKNLAGVVQYSTVAGEILRKMTMAMANMPLAAMVRYAAEADRLRSYKE